MSEGLNINAFDFIVADEFNHIYNDLEEEQKELLDKPSGLTQCLLCSNYWGKKYRLLDFTGTTCHQAIEKILTFYKHKTYRRLIGDHKFFEGFYKEGEYQKIHLGS
jgi:hypothetical protein